MVSQLGNVMLLNRSGHYAMVFINILVMYSALGNDLNANNVQQNATASHVVHSLSLKIT